MATPHAVDEAAVRQRIDTLAEAIRAMDLDGMKAIYAPVTWRSRTASLGSTAR